MTYKNFLLAFSLFFCFVMVGCKTETTKDKKITHKTTEIFQSIIDSIYTENPTSIGIIAHIESPKKGISWSGSAGYSVINKSKKLHANEPALIASSIKTYVSAAILRLQEDKKLTIEDPIANHLTNKTTTLFTNDGYNFKQIKIKHLLSHTSGIDDYVNEGYLDFINKNQKHRWTRDEQMKLAIKVGNPLGQPQDVFKYADVNYLLATEIIEQKTGKPFYKAIRELLKYKELGFENTWFPTLEVQPEGAANLVHQYWNEKEYGNMKLDFSWDSYEHDISWDLFGGGGIATNMKELAQFSYHLFNNNIIKNEQVLKLITTNVPIRNNQPNTYRLGLSDATIKGLQSLGHGGFWGTNVFYIPQLDASIAVCVLERNGKMKPIRSVLNALTEALTKQLYPAAHIIEESHELYGVKNAKKTLILFPGGGATAQQTKTEFDIITAANAHGISVLLMNRSYLWLDQTTTAPLAEDLESIFTKNQLETNNTYIGGMSIGGNVALTLSNYLLKNNSKIKPKGTFIVDSPIDLYALYESSLKDTKNPNFSKERLAEPKWIINHFEQTFRKDSLLENIKKVSPFTLKNQFTSVPNLKNTKLRFYTEPDSLWWKEHRQTNFKSTNAYTILQIAKDLQSKEWRKFELIETENLGYRSNGERHPHSWSIVDVRALINWMNY